MILGLNQIMWCATGRQHQRVSKTHDLLHRVKEKTHPVHNPSVNIGTCLTLPETFATSERQRERVWENKLDCTSRRERATRELSRAGSDARRCGRVMVKLRLDFVHKVAKTTTGKLAPKKKGRDDS